MQAKTKNISSKIVDTFCEQDGVLVEENTWEAICFWFVELCGYQTDQLNCDKAHWCNRLYNNKQLWGKIKLPFDLLVIYG